MGRIKAKGMAFSGNSPIKSSVGVFQFVTPSAGTLTLFYLNPPLKLRAIFILSLTGQIFEIGNQQSQICKSVFIRVHPWLKLFLVQYLGEADGFHRLALARQQTLDVHEAA